MPTESVGCRGGAGGLHRAPWLQIQERPTTQQGCLTFFFENFYKTIWAKLMTFTGERDPKCFGCQGGLSEDTRAELLSPHSMPAL